MIKIINRILLLIVSTLAVFAFIFYLKGGFKNLFGVKTIETTHSLMLEETKALGNLELASFTFKDIVDQKITRDYLPDPRALLIIHGEATGCINLSKIQDQDISVSEDSVIVRLPPPILCHHKIDHSKSTVYDTQYAFMNEGLLFEEAFKSAELKLKESAIKAGILKMTKENAENMLVPIFENISGKKVRLLFDD
ncbi:DUF4230 domain-containing protein [Jiulongibacter sediminis]|uniref:DUF4230 domain-containing protein n=1 Tax=Jiulongibacter sediminis TaxID=1605367 RepID=UPI0006DC0ABF|nr:DUF4230 domain-containing protein [Jiulongibacter sediminis]